ncbi:MAG: TylF/MycF family methyltransferase [Actinobacteria bacterium]|nr:TylF/MycF family methyltransferase [Actinomycetota bacterium]
MGGPELTGNGADEAAALYLGLLKRCLTRLLFIEEEVRDVTDLDGLGWGAEMADAVAAAVKESGLRLVRPSGRRAVREVGSDWPPPPHAETMVGVRRLDNVQHCVTDAVRRGVPGDLLEAGVWRGGTTIFMRALLAALGDSTRRVWVADSFAGVPPPDAAAYPPDAGLHFFSQVPELAVTLEEVRANFARYGLLDERVMFLPGWFGRTLPSAPIDELAVIRLDGDLYQSTMESLAALYPRLSVGGYVIIDDYNNITACRRAVSDYRVSNGIRDPVVAVDWAAAYWQKTG